MSLLTLPQLVVPGVLLLISFLSFSSQLLFPHIEPGPLEHDEALIFNGLVACLLISYYRACAADPGRVPAGWKSSEAVEERAEADEKRKMEKGRWCRKCDMPKPPRAHHCKTCKRCIPKMDHHCPWTINCVSHITLPHFVRFLFYDVMAMSYLMYFLYIRGAILWGNRSLPSYLGPTSWQLIHLFLLIIVNFLTLFALSILLIRTLWNLGANTTTIEGWEIERHEAVLRRAKHFGGYLDGPDGQRVRIVRQEFPYDIGIWANIKQGMGSGNPLSWFWPFSRSPSIHSGLEFEVNGFEDASVTWPPPDPDRIPRTTRKIDPSGAFTYDAGEASNKATIEAFRLRQQEDLKRWNTNEGTVRKRKPFYKRLEEQTAEGSGDESSLESEDGEEGWRNSEGERLADFGVDELTEFYDGPDDDENIPLAHLIQKRKEAASSR